VKQYFLNSASQRRDADELRRSTRVALAVRLFEGHRGYDREEGQSSGTKASRHASVHSRRTIRCGRRRSAARGRSKERFFHEASVRHGRHREAHRHGHRHAHVAVRAIANELTVQAVFAMGSVGEFQKNCSTPWTHVHFKVFVEQRAARGGFQLCVRGVDRRFRRRRPCRVSVTGRLTDAEQSVAGGTDRCRTSCNQEQNHGADFGDHGRCWVGLVG
jgi:hypothetical protein